MFYYSYAVLERSLTKSLTIDWVLNHIRGKYGQDRNRKLNLRWVRNFYKDLIGNSDSSFSV